MTPAQVDLLLAAEHSLTAPQSQPAPESASLDLVRLAQARKRA